MCLRDRAVAWFKGLIKEGLDINNWDVIKAEFLETYEPKYSAKTTCANFTDLNKNPRSPSTTIPTGSRRPTNTSPTTSQPPWLLSELLLPPSLRQKLKASQTPSSSSSTSFFLLDLRMAKKDTFNESVKVARNLETIQNDQKRLNKIAAVKAELQPEEAHEIIC